MKTNILSILIAILVITINLQAGIESIASVSGTDKGVNVNLPAPWTTQVFAGTFKATIDGISTRYIVSTLIIISHTTNNTRM